MKIKDILAYKHLGNKHNQLMHGYRYGKTPNVSRMRRLRKAGLSADYADRARAKRGKKGKFGTSIPKSARAMWEKQGLTEGEMVARMRQARWRQLFMGIKPSGGGIKPTPKPKPVPKPKAKPKPAPKPTPKPNPKPEPEPKKFKPAGTPVSDGLDLGKIPKKGKYGPYIREAVDAINEVHGDGNLPKIPIKLSQSTKNYGSYHYSSSWFGGGVTPTEIKVTKDGDHKPITTLHEIGHFIDHMGIGKPGQYNGVNNPQTKALFESFKKSKAVSRLADMYQNPSKYSVESKETNWKGEPVTYTYNPSKYMLGYYLKDREIFARAYAQYVATRTTNKMVRDSLDYEIAKTKKGKVQYPIQWDHDDFAPIAKEFDKMFENLGWRVPDGS